MKPKIILLITLALSALAPAATIYSDDLSGTANGELNGTAPEIRPGTETWAANSLFQFNGASGVTATASNAVRGAFLPFSPTAGFIYELQVTLRFAAVAASSADTRSLQFGFLEIAPGTSANGAAVASANGGPAFFLRQNGTYEFRTDGGVSGTTGSLSTSTSVTDPHTVRLVLDTSQTLWVLRSYLDGVEIGAPRAFTTNPTLLAVGLSANTSGAVGSVGDFSNFSLIANAIPEPSTSLLAAAAAAGFLIRRRRA